MQCQDNFIRSAYHNDFPRSPGTKVCLKARNLEQLLKAEQLARLAGLPVFKVIDSGCADFFDGVPIVTALGIGPATQAQVQHITKRFPLV